MTAVLSCFLLAVALLSPPVLVNRANEEEQIGVLAAS